MDKTQSKHKIHQLKYQKFFECQTYTHHQRRCRMYLLKSNKMYYKERDSFVFLWQLISSQRSSHQLLRLQEQICHGIKQRQQVQQILPDLQLIQRDQGMLLRTG